MRIQTCIVPGLKWGGSTSGAVFLHFMNNVLFILNLSLVTLHLFPFPFARVVSLRGALQVTKACQLRTVAVCSSVHGLKIVLLFRCLLLYTDAVVRAMVWSLTREARNGILPELLRRKHFSITWCRYSSLLSRRSLEQFPFFCLNRKINQTIASGRVTCVLPAQRPTAGLGYESSKPTPYYVMCKLFLRFESNTFQASICMFSRFVTWPLPNIVVCIVCHVT